MPFLAKQTIKSDSTTRQKQLKNWLCYYADVSLLKPSPTNLKISLIQRRHGTKFALHDYEDNKYLSKCI